MKFHNQELQRHQLLNPKLITALNEILIPLKTYRIWPGFLSQLSYNHTEKLNISNYKQVINPGAWFNKTLAPNNVTKMLCSSDPKRTCLASSDSFKKSSQYTSCQIIYPLPYNQNEAQSWQQIVCPHYFNRNSTNHSFVMDPDQVFEDRRFKYAPSQYGWSWNYDLIDFAEMMCDVKVKRTKSYLDYAQTTL